MQTAVLLPDPSLMGYIHHYWVMKADRISVEMNILPTGLMKWMIHRRDPFMVNGTLDYGHHGDSLRPISRRQRIDGSAEHARLS